MAHITFIHGIENKPPRDALLAIWRQALADNDGIDLDALGVTSSMVYWADVLYPAPLADAIEESVIEASAEPDPQAIVQLAKAAEDPEEARFLAGLAGKLSLAAMQSMVALPAAEIAAELAGVGEGIEERIPLPWVVKEPLMAELLRDVHHYLFNKEFSPRPGETFRVRDEIRKRFVGELARTRNDRGPHVVVSHSMGTVIAYDCLLRAAGCPPIDGLMTIGSPLGLDEIQDQMQPEWTRRDGFPRILRGGWVNVFDRLDPVAGFDPKLANDFQRDGRRVVVDVSKSNWGWWRHNIVKYLAGPELRASLLSLLRVPAPESVDAREMPTDGPLPIGRGPRSTNAGWVSWSDIEQMLAPFEMGAESAEESPVRPPRAGKEGRKRMRGSRFVGEVEEAIGRLRAEAIEQGLGVMSAPQHRLASLIQSAVSEQQQRAVALGIEEFAFDHDDTQAVMLKVKQRAKNIEKHPLVHPSSHVPSQFPDRARVALVSDLGTGLYGAPVIASTIARAGQFDLLMHLGDIYYSGEPDEVQARFLDVWPKGAGDVSRTLNGNHDMYSGGYGYFDLALPEFDQESSYFALQNEHWLLVALDTAHKDNNLGKAQLQWVFEVIEQAGDRRLLLFSHHPLFSNFKKQGKKLAKKLRPILRSKRVTAWYWGHEHHAVIYDVHPRFGLLGRCLGNGGMPYQRSDFADFAVEQRIDGYAWRRTTSLLTPPALYLDGPNPHILAGPEEYGVQGYMTLEFDGPTLTEAVFSADGVQLFRNVIR